jgi:ACR3 family arsenite efflux pump ArsB
MGLFERYLTLWVALGITAGVGLGLAMPGLFQTVAALEVAHVNLVVAVFIWIMIYPMMVQIDWSAVRGVGRRPRGLALTLLVNWLIKPFTMAVAFAPIAAFLLGVTELTVPWTTLVLATVVGVLVEVPVMLSLVWWVNRRGSALTPTP